MGEEGGKEETVHFLKVLCLSKLKNNLMQYT